MEDFDYLHIGLGLCRFGKFKKGDLVEISPEGYNQGIHEQFEDCFGTVEKFENGILTVSIENYIKDFHPCYWVVSDQQSYMDWLEEKRELEVGYA